MANRIETKFRELRKKGQKALVGFITAGDPHLKWTPRAVLSLVEAGVDVVELGMPFSDPMADGPVIQKSSERALRAGTTIKGVLQAVKKIRRQTQIPILLMGYYNPVFHYGVDKFFRDAKLAGVDGSILVDLPPEEGEEARRAARSQGISLIYLLAPTSDQARINLVFRKGSGFVYYVSLTGITGAKLTNKLRSHETLKKILQNKRFPVCVGFGVKTPAQAKEVVRLADGVVVGSAFVDLFSKNKPIQAIAKVRQLALNLSRAVHSII
jgi:tryptophan synthase alpha chain